MPVGETNYPGALDTHSSGNPYGFAVQADNLQTALNAALSSGAATVSVENTTNFPSRGSAWVGTDEFTWTGKNSTGFTGVSGLDSPHLSGEIVAQVPSARNHNDLAAAVVALETKLGISTSTSGAGQVSPSTTIGTMLQVVSTAGQTGWGKSWNSVATAVGHMVYASSANVPAGLPIGSSGDVLEVSTAGLPTWVRQSRAIVSRGSTFNVADNTVVGVQWDTQIADNDGMHSTVSNSSRLTFKTPGLYDIKLFIWWEIGSSGYRYASIRDSSGTVLAGSRFTAILSNYTEHSLSAYKVATSTAQYVIAVVAQANGSTLDVRAESKFSAARIGPASS